MLVFSSWEGQMAMDKRGYWDYQQCRWVGTDPSYVVPPAAGATLPADAGAPVVEAVPAQRPGSTLLSGAPEAPLAPTV